MIMKQKTCNLQGNRFFWFSYDEFVSFCIWLSVLHVLLGVNNPSVNQISTCTKGLYESLQKYISGIFGNFPLLLNFQLDRETDTGPWHIPRNYSITL